MNLAARESQHRGFTLVEMAICITIGAIIFGVTFELLATALQVDSPIAFRGVNLLASPASFDRLAEQFRADVHQATEVISAVPEDTRASLTLKLPADRRIEYAIADQVLLRTEYAGNDVKSRDAFWLPPNTKMHWEAQPVEKNAVTKQSTARVTMLSLFLEQRPTDSTSARAGNLSSSTPASSAGERSLRIDATLGLDHRLTRLK